MNVVLFMIPLTLLFIFAFLMSFVWAVRNGQFDDTETPAHRILFNEEEGTEDGRK